MYGAIIKSGCTTQHIGGHDVNGMLEQIEFFLTHNERCDYIVIANTDTRFKIETEKVKE
jgi:hypothetical protein